MDIEGFVRARIDDYSYDLKEFVNIKIFQMKIQLKWLRQSLMKFQQL